ncbi:MAG: ribosome recycling factor [Flavobacteriaceae bacterium]|nr:ribosome recycling factor [Flavobacteriaceae bacterium]MCY4268086.1 ribosome recycling factor [Flavobacteriaceae bacterium]MCY4298572.1 ribosome recycling factor [Flavobacteriaceae bacterium]
MNEEIEFVLEEAKESMELGISHLATEFQHIRTGRASPVMLSSVFIDYYGQSTPLNKVASINTPDANTIFVQPWDKKQIPEIEKGIMKANLGFNPINNGEMVIINVPPLTEERRKNLVKFARSEAEKARISIRQARQEANQNIKNADASEDLQQNCQIDIQELTDKYNDKISKMLLVKEEEIMAI